MSKLPEGITFTLKAYVRSDKAGNGGIISVGGRCDMSALSEEALTEFVGVACKALNEMLEVDDARPMTDEERKEYDEDNAPPDLVARQQFSREDLEDLAS